MSMLKLRRQVFSFGYHAISPKQLSIHHWKLFSQLQIPLLNHWVVLVNILLLLLSNIENNLSLILVRCIDNYAAQKIRQMESKYPVINTPTEDVVNTLNEKAEPVRNVMNSVKDTTTSTIQHGKETVNHSFLGIHHHHIRICLGFSCSNSYRE